MNATLQTIPADVETRLELMTQPHESMTIEAVSSAAMAWHKEQNDYEGFMQAWRIYLLARRKTTELVKAEIEIHNTHVTDTDYGFTAMQWSRRLKELAIPQPRLDAYFDELVSNGWQPSVNGLLRHVSGQQLDRFANAVVELKHSLSVLLSDEYFERLAKAQRTALNYVSKLFAEESEIA